MHIPDGFLDAKTAAAAGVLAAMGLGTALVNVRRTVAPGRVPLIGLAAAFIFAAQMLNFPIAGGTSGHLIGAVLAAVLLGPSAAVLAMSAVLILQCLMFADGGVTALGANLFNMALVAPMVGYLVYRLLRRLTGGGLRGRLFAAAFAAWCSTVASALSCAGQLALSRTVAWKVALPAMGGIHMLIGLGEAVITTMVLAAVVRVRPELLEEHGEPRPLSRHGWLAAQGLVVSLGLVVFVAPFASSWPDGLEKVAGSLGFGHRAAETPLLPAPLRDYGVPGIDSSAVSTAAAGAAGTLIAFVVAGLLARILTPRGRAGAPARQADRGGRASGDS